MSEFMEKGRQYISTLPLMSRLHHTSILYAVVALVYQMAAVMGVVTEGASHRADEAWCQEVVDSQGVMCSLDGILDKLLSI
jgi:hypothetical protein